MVPDKTGSILCFRGVTLLFSKTKGRTTNQRKEARIGVLWFISSYHANSVENWNSRIELPAQNLESKLTCLIIVMGVSGSGKTLVGAYLAQQLGFEFVDGDDMHPIENIERMSAGIELDDEARLPWLDAMCRCAESHFSAGTSVVIACSALKSKYRDRLRSVSRPTMFLHLSGPSEVIKQRLDNRAGHFMPASLLESQFASLEIPIGEPNVVTINIDQSLELMLREALDKTHDQLKQITSEGGGRPGVPPRR